MWIIPAMLRKLIKKRPLIYLAGFERYDSNGEEVFARMKEICAKYGYEAISPLDRAPGVQGNIIKKILI